MNDYGETVLDVGDDITNFYSVIRSRVLDREMRDDDRAHLTLNPSELRPWPM